MVLWRNPFGCYSRQYGGSLIGIFGQVLDRVAMDGWRDRYGVVNRNQYIRDRKVNDSYLFMQMYGTRLQLQHVLIL